MGEQAVRARGPVAPPLTGQVGGELHETRALAGIAVLSPPEHRQHVVVGVHDLLHSWRDRCHTRMRQSLWGPQRQSARQVAQSSAAASASWRARWKFSSRCAALKSCEESRRWSEIVHTARACRPYWAAMPYSAAASISTARVPWSAS